MGCCGGVFKDPEIERATTMDEVIAVMKKKRDNLAEEKTQISNFLEDETKTITLVKVDGLTKEDLEKRIPYLDKLSDCYEEIIDELEAKKTLPLKETKEYLYNILNHYFVSYDSTEAYRNDLAKFKQFTFANDKKV
jgi:GTPase involved in cell partitioning and DNA repair